MGDSALEVLDGRRAATGTERIDAALAGLRLRAYTHLMERTPSGHLPGAAVTRAERTADALALELLAPVAAAGPLTELAGPGAAAALVARFGLPPEAARRYAAELGGPAEPSDGLLRRLGLGGPGGD